MAFSLGRDAAVRVRIYDVAGRLVRGVDVGHLAAGRHLAVWDGRDDNGQRVSAAPYFVRLEVDGRPVGVKRLIIMQ